MWKILVFRLYTDNNPAIFEYLLSHRDIIILSEETYMTAYQARAGQDIRLSILNSIIDDVYEGFNINDGFLERDIVRDLIFYNIAKSKSTVNCSPIEPIKVDNTPQDIKDAIIISEKAVEYAKDIKAKESEIRKMTNKYYKKYWTLTQKLATYFTFNK